MSSRDVDRLAESQVTGMKPRGRAGRGHRKVERSCDRWTSSTWESGRRRVDGRRGEDEAEEGRSVSSRELDPLPCGSEADESLPRSL